MKSSVFQSQICSINQMRRIDPSEKKSIMYFVLQKASHKFRKLEMIKQTCACNDNNNNNIITSKKNMKMQRNGYWKLMKHF